MSEFTRRGGEQLFSPLSLSVLLTVFHDRYVDTDSVENKQKEGQTLLGWMAGNRNLGSSAVPRKKRRCHDTNFGFTDETTGRSRRRLG
jgi:hypothetical protein